MSLALRRGEALGLRGQTAAARARCSRSFLRHLCRRFGKVVVRAPVTPILELGVGWNPELDAVDNIFLIGALMGMTLAQLRRDLHEILDFAELTEFAGMRLKHYSSGMAARLAYAVAFRAVREVLILDEILAVGDAGFKQRCEERYRRLRAAGCSAIVVSHTPDSISTFCDRALLLEKGRFVMAGPAKDVADAYVKRLTQGSARM